MTPKLVQVNFPATTQLRGRHQEFGVSEVLQTRVSAPHRYTSRTNTMIGCPLYELNCRSRYPHFSATRIDGRLSGLTMQVVRRGEKCSSPQRSAARAASVA